MNSNTGPETWYLGLVPLLSLLLCLIAVMMVAVSLKKNKGMSAEDAGESFKLDVRVFWL